MSNEDGMMKVRIFKQPKDTNDNYCHECGHHENESTIIAGVTEWDEIDIEDYRELREAIYNANCIDKNWRYFVIVLEDLKQYEPIFRSAKEYVAHFNKLEQKRKEAEEKEKEAARIKKEQKQLKTLEQKRKKLEELKKELGEQ